MSYAAVYALGYPATYWLEGRGAIDAIKIEGTLYPPIQQYRLSALPGARSVDDLRMWCFHAGQDSVWETHVRKPILPTIVLALMLAAGYILSYAPACRYFAEDLPSRPSGLWRVYRPVDW